MIAGQTIHVQAPDGRLNAIVIPPGFGPGSTFTVEFAPPDQGMPQEQAAKPYMMAAAHTGVQDADIPYYPSAPVEKTPASTATTGPYQPPPNPHRPDDGFASGFGSSSVPTAAPVYPGRY